MNRFLAAIILVVWTACYVRCVEAIGDSAPREDVTACCKHEQPAESGSPEKDNSCTICDAILSGGLLLSQPLLMAAVFWVVVSVLAMSAVFAAWRKLGAKEAAFFHRIPDPPWRLSKLWELLVRTACPVRGPSLMPA